MKNPILLFKTMLFVSLISISCSQEIPDPVQAQKFIEGFMEKKNQNDFTNLSDFYSHEMLSGESDEQRIAKFTQLYNALGKMESFKLLQSKEVNEPSSPPSVELTYEVTFSRQVVIEIYSVVKDGDQYKISKQNTVSKSAWTGITN